MNLPEQARPGAPDLPDTLTPVPASDGADLYQAVVEPLAGAIPLRGATIEECRLGPGSPDALDLQAASLMDVEIENLQTVRLSCSDSTWRRVRINGGRIGSLDLAGARLADVEFRNVRIDYLNAGQAQLEDVLVIGCIFRTLDVPEAQVRRMTFGQSRADEIETRGMEARHLDLRGLDVEEFLSPLDLRGVTLTPGQVQTLAEPLALATGIRLG